VRFLLLHLYGAKLRLRITFRYRFKYSDQSFQQRLLSCESRVRLSPGLLKAKTRAILIWRSQYFHPVIFETVHPLATLSIWTEKCQAFPGARQCCAAKRPPSAEICDFFFDRGEAAMETSFTAHDEARQ
jgi:hypothetical protein